MADGSITIDTSLDNSGIERDLKKLGTLAKNGAAVSAKAFAVLQGAIVAAGGYALKVGDDYQKALNQIQASTGATAKEMEALSDTVKEVYSAGMGESMEDVANAIQNVQKNIGGTKEEIEQATKSAIGFRDTFGYEVEESTRAAKAMMDNFGISAEQAYNLMAQGAQNGLDYSGEMIDNINEYSVQFAKLGLGAEDMFNIFQNGAENGAWNLDKVGDAIKEFSIRAIDGSNTTIDGFQRLGMNADEMAQKFASGGDVAKDAFYEVIQALGEMDDPVSQSIAGVDLFGTMWEDLGPNVVTQLGNIQTAYDVTKNTMEEINNIKFHDVESALKSIKRNVETALLIPISEQAMPLVNEFAKETIKSIKSISDSFEKGGFEGLSTALGEELAKGLTEMAKAAPDFVEVGIDITTSFVKGLLANADGIADAGVDMVETLAKALLGEDFGEDVGQFAEDVKDTFFTLAEAGKKAIGELHPLISNFTSILLDVAGTALPMAAKAVSLLASNSKILATALLAVGGGVGALKAFQKVSGMVSAVTSSFQTAADAARAFANGTSRSLTAGQAAVGLFQGTVTRATASTTIFQSAIAALGGPVGALVLAVGAVTAGVVAYSLASEKSESATAKNRKAIEEMSESLEKEKKAYEEMEEASQKRIAVNMHEIDTAEELIKSITDSADGIVDANGKVKEGYEDRARALAEEINSILPDAIELIEEEGDMYLKTADKMDVLIAKKRIDALLDANMEKYTAAVEKRQESIEKLIDAENELRIAEELRDEAQSRLLSGQASEQEYAALLNRVDEARENVEGFRKDIETASEDIQKNNELMAASTSDDLDTMNEALGNYTYSYKEYTGEQIEAAKEQYENAEEYYQRTKELFEEGTLGISEAEVETAKNGRDKAKAIYDEALQDQKKNAEEISKQVQENMVETTATSLKALRDTLLNGKADVAQAATETISAVPETAKTIGPEMESIGKDLMAGIEKGIVSREQSLKDIATSVVNGIKNVFTGIKGFIIASPSKWGKKVGAFVTEGIGIGLKEKEPYAVQMAGEVIEAVKGQFSKVGEGMKTSFGAELLEELSRESLEQAKASGGDYEEIGKQFADNYITGLSDIVEESISLMEDMVDEDVKAYEEKVDAELEVMLAKEDEKIEVLQEKKKKASEVEKKALEEQIKALQKQKKVWQDNAKEQKKQVREDAEGIVKAYEETILEKLDAFDKELNTKVSEITATFQKQKDEIVSQQEKLQSNADEFGSLFRYDEETGEMILNNLDKQTEKMQAYYDKVAQLKALGASDVLLTEVLDYKGEEGLQLIDELLAGGRSKIEDMSEALAEQQKLLSEGAKDIFAEDLRIIDENYNKAMGEMADKLVVMTQDMNMELGQALADILLQGFAAAGAEVPEETKKLLESIGAEAEKAEGVTVDIPVKANVEMEGMEVIEETVMAELPGAEEANGAVEEVIGALLEREPELDDTVESIVESMVKTMRSHEMDFYNVGGLYMDALIQGMQDKWGVAVDVARLIADSLKEEMEEVASFGDVSAMAASLSEESKIAEIYQDMLSSVAARQSSVAQMASYVTNDNRSVTTNNTDYGDVTVNIDKVMQGGNPSVKSILLETEAYRKQRNLGVGVKR